MSKKTVLMMSLCVAMFAGAAGASPVVIATEGPYFAGYSSCGEFKITVAGDIPIGMYAVGDSFQTFCLEKDEAVWTPGTGAAYDWVLNTSALAGGGGAVGGEDPICPQTAYLYTQFFNQTLSNYDFTNAGSNRVADGTELADAIRYLEDEIVSVDGKAADWVAEANQAVSSNAWVGLGNVRVLNLYDYDNSDPVAEYFGVPDSEYTTFRQDVLVMVPEPATMSLVVMGGLAVVLRRRK